MADANMNIAVKLTGGFVVEFQQGKKSTSQMYSSFVPLPPIGAMVTLLGTLPLKGRVEDVSFHYDETNKTINEREMRLPRVTIFLGAPPKEPKKKKPVKAKGK